MEKTFQKEQASLVKQENENKEQKNEVREAKLQNALSLLQCGVSLQELSLEDLRLLSSYLGNQDLLKLLNGSDVKLAKTPVLEKKEIPENSIEVPWPALVPKKAPDAINLKKSAFLSKNFKPIGTYERI